MKEIVFEIPLGRPRPQAVVGDEGCDHKETEATVEVTCLEDSGKWAADLKLKCSKCGVPFRFIGVPGGLSFSHPTITIDGQELCMPIEPAHVPRLVALEEC